MKLKNLKIELKEWGPFEGRYVGEIEFTDETGKVCMTLDPEISNALLATCSQQIVALTQKSSAKLAESLQQSIAEAKGGPALTA